MRRIRNSPLLLTCLALCAVISVAYAATPELGAKSNSYYLYTQALNITDSGVVAVPSRFKWSIETSWSGIDAQGKDLPDTRVMMRLYDPDQNFTALTAQMDLATAEKLQRELADIIAKKRENADYQYRPQLYDASLSNSMKERVLGALPPILNAACTARAGCVPVLPRFRWLRAGTWFGLPNQTSRSLRP